jgi:hypothetical protein
MSNRKNAKHFSGAAINEREWKPAEWKAAQIAFLWLTDVRRVTEQARDALDLI